MSEINYEKVNYLNKLRSNLKKTIFIDIAFLICLSNSRRSSINSNFYNPSILLAIITIVLSIISLTYSIKIIVKLFRYKI